MTYKIKEVFPTRDAQAFVDIVKMDAEVRKWADGYNMNYWRRYEHPPGRTAVS